MTNDAKAIERIEALSDVPVPYVILGANWIAYQEEADYAWYEACVDECIEHASSVLDRLHSEFALKQIRGPANYSMEEFGLVQAIEIGNKATAKALNLVKALGLDPDTLFDPFSPDAELLTGVTYAYKARKRIDQNSAASADQTLCSHHDAGHSAQTDEHNEASTADGKEQQCQDTEGVATAITEPSASKDEASHDQATPERQVNRPVKKPRYEETARTRTRDFTGLVHVNAKQIPQFSSVTPDTGDRLVWYFEVVVHDLQAAIIEAINRRSPGTTSGDLPGFGKGIQAAGSKKRTRANSSGKKGGRPTDPDYAVALKHRKAWEKARKSGQFELKSWLSRLDGVDQEEHRRLLDLTSSAHETRRKKRNSADNL